MPVDYRLSTFAIALIAGRCKYVRTVIDNDILRFAGFFQRFVCVGIIMNMRPLGFDVRLRSSTSFGDIGQRMPSLRFLMILVSWLQTQTLAKCSSMRNPLPLT